MEIAGMNCIAKLTRFPIGGPLAACLVFLLAACDSAPREALRVSSSPWPGYEPLYLARDLGYLNPKHVNLFELPSADINMESFRNRSADLSTLTLDEALELMHDGIKLRILLVMDVSNGADAVLARPEIKNLADLKGKRIATSNIPLGFYMLNRTLEAAGLSRSDVEVLPMSESKHEQFYREGKVDAVVTMEPYSTNIANLGAKRLFDSSRIPNEIVDLMMVHEDVYQARRTEVCALVRQWFRSLDYIRAQPKDAAQRISRRLKVQESEYHAMVRRLSFPSRADNLRMLGGEKPALLDTAHKLMAVMQREKQLSGPVNPALAFDPAISDCLSE
jgi:NitT/TauT family transport system substrate-binding protein